nr:hypothetical protein GCM10025732_14170 [Glycomyces mayteni]
MAGTAVEGVDHALRAVEADHAQALGGRRLREGQAHIALADHDQVDVEGRLVRCRVVNHSGVLCESAGWVLGGESRLATATPRGPTRANVNSCWLFVHSFVM